MPVPAPATSRYEQSFSPPPMSATPSRSSYSRTLNNTSAYSPTVTSVNGAGHSRLNVVTRVAIEGKAKQGQDGASIRMFLKICLPLDSVAPGSTIPLFPEENVKIHTSQVHPLDNNGVPYNFSSTVSPLLHNAARALSLPPRSHEDFYSVHGLSKLNGHSSRSLKPENGDNVLPIDVQYTGHILVSGYSISFVLPKVFLQRRKDSGHSDTEGGTPRTPANSTRRRHSIGEKNQIFFMAAIDMWIPFLSKPPRSPFLLSIPNPRCMHNSIKLRIFPPPVTTSSSFASLSSVEEDGAAWDLTTEPHVTRNAARPSRSRSYTHFADDESSESSTSTDACVIQGSFPTAERLRIRWAKPTRQLDIPGNDTSGRRRVGVEESKGEMTCAVRGKGKRAERPEVEGILIHVEYKGQCQGIWYAGVATLLGLDVSLVAKGSEISWPQGYPTQWEVSGGIGYTGFDNGSASVPSAPSSRTTSLEPDALPPVLPPGNGSVRESGTAFLTARSTSNASLLRAPLPIHNVNDYSFEGSAATLPASSTGSPGPETLSLIGSLPTSSEHSLSPPSPIRDPGVPLTLHLNMNDLQTPQKNSFTYTISGTVLLVPKTPLGRVNGPNESGASVNGKTNELEPIGLPRFTVLAANTESTSILIRNEVEGASVEVFNPTGDIQHDPQTRKTVLQKNGFTRCNEDGGRIILKSFDTLYPALTNTNGRHLPRPRTPSNTVPRVSSGSPITRSPFPTRNKPDGPSIIPWVKATVTALAPNVNEHPTGYAIRVTLQTPSLGDSEWLEFGIACGSVGMHQKPNEPHPHGKVHLVCASLNGVPVKAELSKVNKTEAHTAGVPAFEELGGKEWICWGKAHVGSLVGAPMLLDYIVKDTPPIFEKDAKKWNDDSAFEILLPTFFVPIARLEVYVDRIPGLEITSLFSNFDYHCALPEGNRLLRYSVEEFNQPQLSLRLRKTTVKNAALPMRSYFISTWLILLVAFCLLYHLLFDMRHLQKRNDGYNDSWSEIPAVTVTTTVYSTPQVYRTSLAEEETSTPALSTSSRTDIALTPTLKPTPTISLQYPERLTTSATQEQTTETFPVTSLTNRLSPRLLLESLGLVPANRLFRMNFSSEHNDTIKRALNSLIGTFEVVWGAFRKVYHYPLDPP